MLDTFYIGRFIGPFTSYFWVHLFKEKTKLVMVVYTFNSSTLEAEAGRSLEVQGQPGVHTKFQAN